MRRAASIALALALALGPAACGGSSGGGNPSAGSTGAPVGGTGPGAVPRGPRSAPARRLPTLTLPAHAPARGVTVPILTWHRVTPFAKEPVKSVPDLTVEPSVFAGELDAIARRGFHTITQQQLYDALFRGRALPPRPVLLTVDDGYVDDVRTILPQLQARHMVATFYIITARFHEPGFVNETEVRRLDAAGMDVGAHTRTHVPLNAVPTAEMKGQILGSRNDLQRVLGHPVQWFAYPYGSYNAAVVAEVRKAGFVLAVTTQGGTRASAQAPLTIPRIHVGRAATPASVLACSGGATGCGGGPAG